MQHDAENDAWVSLGVPFDFIYSRYIISCFDNTRAVLRHCWDSLAPGGYVEIFDMQLDPRDAGEVDRGCAYVRWAEAVCRGATAVGRDLSRSTRYPDWCREVGFVDVVAERFTIPCGTWPEDPHQKEIGLRWQRDLLSLVRGLRRFFSHSGLSLGEQEQLEADAIRDIMDPSRRLAATA